MSTPLNGSLLKGVAILDLFTAERPEITAAIVTSELAMNAATAHRFLTTLVEAGVLISFQRGRYCLSQKMRDLGRIADQSLQLGTLVQPIIEQAARTLNESVMACRFTDLGPQCLAVASSSRPISVNIKVGTTLPMHASAQGKLWLAFAAPRARAAHLAELALVPHSARTITDAATFDAELDSIATQKCATNSGENEENIGACAVPVFDAQGRMILSLSAFGMLSRFDAALQSRARACLSQAAAEITALGVC
ncbi:IclR family transcriptional regulator [Cognatishimia sp. SS12]|uniref:IclR family transcriptional regulator n=1 Tax=Cognatishimia sp. SS12 TaxID=2979465 RepID=UPI00232ABA78|nr:IclR family transcriptional regulator [Cognatishimia sp. SS12]MDC0739340.1 IclR family transcriptional regulator [Cognatishimia sp. SS12]